MIPERDWHMLCNAMLATLLCKDNNGFQLPDASATRVQAKGKLVWIIDISGYFSPGDRLNRRADNRQLTVKFTMLSGKFLGIQDLVFLILIFVALSRIFSLKKRE